MSNPLILHVRLTPRAAANKITGWMTDQDGRRILKACVTAVPESGKANAALIRLLAGKLGVAKSDISLASGSSDRNKRLILNNVLPGDLKKLE